MDLIWSIILGLIQGLTEFLPVSSSGHLVISQHFIPGFSQPGVLFDVVLHLGTLFAVVYFFRKKILTLSRQYYLLLIIGTIPAGLFGILFQKSLESTFGDYKMLGIELIITGILNFLIDKANTAKDKITYENSLLIGIGQAIAIIPGISRSGTTIFTGVKLGIDRKKAAEFSFLLSIPAILGANIIQIISHGLSNIPNPLYYFVGFLAALLSGVLSIRLVFKTLSEKKFGIFGIYCIVLGVLVLLF